MARQVQIKPGMEGSSDLTAIMADFPLSNGKLQICEYQDTWQCVMRQEAVMPHRKYIDRNTKFEANHAGQSQDTSEQNFKIISSFFFSFFISYTLHFCP